MIVYFSTLAEAYPRLLVLEINISITVLTTQIRIQVVR